MQILWKSKQNFCKKNKKKENRVIHLLDLATEAVVIWIKGDQIYFLKALKEVY